MNTVAWLQDYFEAVCPLCKSEVVGGYKIRVVRITFYVFTGFIDITVANK